MKIEEMLEGGVNLTEVFPKEVRLAQEDIILRRGVPLPKVRISKYPREKLYALGWPVNPGSYQVRDAATPVAVVCPRQDLELQEAALHYGAAISGPCITPDRGIELVVSNIISNPNIRWLILAGKDSGHLAGEALYCLWRYGINPETRRILNTRCPTNPYLFNLPDEAIAQFREQVQVINILGAKNRDPVELGFLIRCCLQEPDKAIGFTHTRLGDELLLFDPGSGDEEPLLVDLRIRPGQGYIESFGARVGTTVHAFTVAESYPMLKAHILESGSLGMQESSRFALDVIGTQVVIHNTEEDLVPADWRPFGFIQSDEDAAAYTENYRVWVYLFPLSDVRLEDGKWVPYFPDKMDYAYGTQLTAWGYDLADEVEREAIRRLVQETHQRFRGQLPSFADIVAFYQRLVEVQKRACNQLWKTAEAARLCREEGIGASYRLYMTLQIPPLHVSTDPRLAHNPCFALYEVYPRLVEGEWQLDACLFLRANDFLAYPANANGGIAIQRFLAEYAGMRPGVYLHHTGCLHICDYMLPPEIIRSHREFEGG